MPDEKYLEYLEKEIESARERWRLAQKVQNSWADQFLVNYMRGLMAQEEIKIRDYREILEGHKKKGGNESESGPVSSEG